MRKRNQRQRGRWGTIGSRSMDGNTEAPENNMLAWWILVCTAGSTLTVGFCLGMLFALCCYNRITCCLRKYTDSEQKPEAEAPDKPRQLTFVCERRFPASTRMRLFMLAEPEREVEYVTTEIVPQSTVAATETEVATEVAERDMPLPPTPDQETHEQGAVTENTQFPEADVPETHVQEIHARETDSGLTEEIDTSGGASRPHSDQRVSVTSSDYDYPLLERLARRQNKLKQEKHLKVIPDSEYGEPQPTLYNRDSLPKEDDSLKKVVTQSDDGIREEKPMNETRVKPTVAKRTLPGTLNQSDKLNKCANLGEFVLPPLEYKRQSDHEVEFGVSPRSPSNVHASSSCEFLSQYESTRRGFQGTLQREVMEQWMQNSDSEDEQRMTYYGSDEQPYDVPPARRTMLAPEPMSPPHDVNERVKVFPEPPDRDKLRKTANAAAVTGLHHCHSYENVCK